MRTEDLIFPDARTPDRQTHSHEPGTITKVTSMGARFTLDRFPSTTGFGPAPFTSLPQPGDRCLVAFEGPGIAGAWIVGSWSQTATDWTPVTFSSPKWTGTAAARVLNDGRVELRGTAIAADNTAPPAAFPMLVPPAATTRRPIVTSAGLDIAVFAANATLPIPAAATPLTSYLDGIIYDTE